MNIIGVSTVRNEQDIIEAFVRHNLAHCDRLLIMDHGSTDATPAILRSLQEEGLALEVFRDETVGRIQAILMGRLSHRAAQELQADWIFFLDADEFIQGDVRCVLSRCEASGAGYLQCRLVNYVVRVDDDAAEPNPVKRIRHRTIDPPPSPKNRKTCKSIVSGRLVRQDGFLVGSGNHQVTVRGAEPPYEILEDLWLGHFSLRAPCQYGGKLVSVMFQRYGKRARQAGNADFYQADYGRLRESYTEFIRNFVDVKLAWWSKEVSGIECCPIDYRGGALRYTPTCSDVDQFIRNTLDLGLHIAQQSCAAGGDEERGVVFIALKNGEDTLQKQSFEANTASFREFRFPTEYLKERNRLVLELCCGPGMVELERVTLKFEDGSLREFCGNALEDLVRVAKDGMAARGGGTIQRFFTSIPALLLNVWGNPRETTELRVSLRFLNQPRMVSMAVGDYSGIQWFHRELKKREMDPLPVRTPLNTIFLLTRLEQSCVAIGEGWRELRFSGLRLSKNRGRLGLRFDEALKGRIKLRFEAKLKSCNAQPKTENGPIRIFSEGALAAVWQFRQKRRRWFEIDIAANPAGRRGIDLIFETEDETVNFWLLRVKVECLHERGRMVGTMREVLDFLERKLMPKEQPRCLAAGDVVRFGAGGNGTSVAAMGWAPPQGDGIRAEAQLAVLRFPFTAARSEHLRIRLLLAGGKSAGVVRLAWEHIDLTAFWLDAHTPQWVEIDLPSFAARREQITLLFRCNEKSMGFELREMMLQSCGTGSALITPV